MYEEFARVSIMITTLQCSVTREKLCEHEHCVCGALVWTVSSAASCLESRLTTASWRSNAALAGCCRHRSLQLGLKGQVAWEKVGWGLETPSGLLFLSVCVCVFTRLQCPPDYWNIDKTVACSLYHPASTCTRFHRCVYVCVCTLSQVILTVPMRWPAPREHTKVPVPCNMVLTQDWGALSWSLMVWLTVGMYGSSITDSRQAMFTDTPVTVPARCLKRRDRDQSVRQTVKINCFG